MNTLNISKENKKNNTVEIIQSKRATWNTRRKYNYKYITTVF
ncbi:hypothetical protein [Polaribacter marinus]|nr:hypothetical protein [Polaribacter marinus]